MTKTMTQGGQRRTIQLGCGFMFSGSVRECEFKVKLHRKKCSMCGIDNAMPCEFNKSVAKHNGWNGLRGTNKVSNIISTDINGIPR